MKAYVVHFTSVGGATTLASAGIAKFIQNHLKKVFKWDVEIISTLKEFMEYYSPEKADYVFFVNSPWGFCNFREQAVILWESARNRVWVQNDFAIARPSVLVKANNDYKVLTTIPGKGAYINWNQLTYSTPPLGKREVFYPNGVLYYGAYRVGRLEYFQKYFGGVSGKWYETHISSTQWKRFKLEFPEAKCYGPMPKDKFRSMVPKWGATIYMEDKYSHDNYCSPANRFYECLSAGIPMAIDKNAVHSLKTAGLGGVEEFVVSCPAEVAEFLSRREIIRKKQRELWTKDYKALLGLEFNEALKEVVK